MQQFWPPTTAGHRIAAVACVLVFLTACSGELGSFPDRSPSPSGGSPGAGASGGSGGTSDSPSDRPNPPAGDVVHFASAPRRLTKAELRLTLEDLIGKDVAGDLTSALAAFPEDYGEAGDVFAFDNQYTLQQPSAALIESAKNLAESAAVRLRARPGALERLLPCAPQGPADAVCFRAFVERFGRRVFRRPLDPSEVAAYVDGLAPYATETADFGRAVALVVRAMLQDPQFLYRIELGEPVASRPGLVKLTPFELGTRLAYFLWGTTPDDALLDLAASPGALDGTTVRTVAERMLADPRARHGVRRFHSLWLGYERQAPTGALAAAMRAVSDALVDRVVIEQGRPWLELFRSSETFVDGPLAAHYGLPAPAGGGTAWVPYGDSGRTGLLSHGSFLGVERKHEDTSPTMRGHFLRTRVLCQAIPPPPPDVDTDSAPVTGTCKADRYSMWRAAGCKACHQLMDPLGLGLEGFDRVGKARAVAPGDEGKAGCEVKGQGDLVGFEDGASAPFSGVVGLAERLVASGTLERCVTEQLAGFLLGRPMRDEERATFEVASTRFRSGGQRFRDLLLDFVTLPGFAHRLAE